MTGDSSPTGPRHRLRRAAVGVLAAAVVLGSAELVSAWIAANASPFYAVGAEVVDRTPPAVQKWAIATFGTADKLALFVFMALGIAAITAAAGLLERRTRPVGSAVLVGLGAVGVAAALGRAGADWTYALPTVVGVGLGVLVLRALVLRTPGGSGAGRAPAALSRRGFLAATGVIAALAVGAGLAGRHLGEKLRAVAADRAGFLIPLPASTAKPIPAGAQVDTPGMPTFVTSNEEFYRIDTALQVPALTEDEWELRIHGMVEQEVRVRFPDLRSREAVERVVTLTCVSNEVGGNLVGNATWIGYPLKDLLEQAGPLPDADMILSTSIDGFTAGTPLEALTDGRDAILAVAMNGEPLPPEHGYPARMVVPGLYGYVSATKWVVDLEVTRFDRAQAYWTKRGWSAFGPIKTASRIDVPAAFARVPAGKVAVAGTAWAQTRGIAKVEVRVDGGPWNEARLGAAYTKDTWRQWAWEWEATPGNHTIEVRATDGTGQTQTEQRARPIPDGATGWPTRAVQVV